MANTLSYEQRRQRNRLRYPLVPYASDCPVCGWHMAAPDLWLEDEMFCQECDTLLRWEEEEQGGRWIVVGVYGDDFQ